MRWKASERPPTWMVISEASLSADSCKSCIFALIWLHVEQRWIASRRRFSQVVPDGKGGMWNPQPESLQFVVKCSSRRYQLLCIRHFHTADGSGKTRGWESNVMISGFLGEELSWPFTGIALGEWVSFESRQTHWPESLESQKHDSCKSVDACL